MVSATAAAQPDGEKGNTVREQGKAETDARKSRLTIGGYGEAVMTRYFHSDKYLRYTDAQNEKNAASHGRFDLPHVVIYLGYDFGHGWTLGSEIEFEHGGTESSVEIEAEEGGEYESEIERGGEVALEQFWIQKSFCPQVNLRMGHIIVPVGQTNNRHMPTEFFGVYRPREKTPSCHAPGTRPAYHYGERHGYGTTRAACATRCSSYRDSTVTGSAAKGGYTTVPVRHTSLK